MDKLEKVIKGLEHCGQPTVCDGCPYKTGMAGKCFTRLKSDALELLKAQEPVKPRAEETSLTYFYGDKYSNHFCGECGAVLSNGQKYCSECGRAVKWDG